MASTSTSTILTRTSIAKHSGPTTLLLGFTELTEDTHFSEIGKTEKSFVTWFDSRRKSLKKFGFELVETSHGSFYRSDAIEAEAKPMFKINFGSHHPVLMPLIDNLQDGTRLEIFICSEGGVDEVGSSAVKVIEISMRDQTMKYKYRKMTLNDQITGK